MAPFYLSDTIQGYERSILQDGRLQVILVDGRLNQGLPRLGVYFEPGEPGAGEYKEPLSTTALWKLEPLGCINRFYHSGDIVLYDVSALAGTPPVTFAGPAAGEASAGPPSMLSAGLAAVLATIVVVLLPWSLQKLFDWRRHSSLPAAESSNGAEARRAA